MLAAEIRPSGPGVSVGTPRQLFETKAFAITDLGADYDVSADGRRFLALSPVLDRTGKAITVALNWLHTR